MEDLNKHQIILLTLLISFVTSIATGIMTVSLLQEAPLEITRNINRIVEKTIETVIPATVAKPAEREVTTVTVVVKEEDLVIDSINKNVNSIVRIIEKEVDIMEQSFYGIGLIINKDGSIIADRKTISGTSVYTAVTSNGAEFRLTPVGVDKQTNFIIFKSILVEKNAEGKEVKSSYVFVPVTLSVREPKLGQTLISIGGVEENSVGVGRAASFEMKESGTGTSSIKFLAGINTDISQKDFVSGSPLFNLDGDLVALKSTPDASKLFTPAEILRKEIILLSEPPKLEKTVN